MSIRTIDAWLRLVALKINLHGLHGSQGKWVRLRNNLYRERRHTEGRKDREAGNYCSSVDGGYLEGYHDDSRALLHYVTWDQLEELR